VGAYYYLVAQLPSLIYGQEPPMSSARFLDLAQGLLSAGDGALLGKLSLDPGPSLIPQATGCGFIDQWRDWERSLRLNLARLRALRLKREATADPPLVPADAAGAAQQALALSESPLEAEALLDKARWSAIERFQGTTYFDRNTVFAYLLKLLILERSASFKTETGFAEYKSLYASILERVRPGAGESK
jgi:hypothetical protein